MVNIKMTLVFRHPKYYKELRKRNKSDQAISYEHSTESEGVRPGPGQQHQASSIKLQASSSKSLKLQAASIKPQAASIKLKATSGKLHDT
jgi:hypothetical protein